ncbi:SCO family protein [Pseudomonas sp. 273]|uniref:SCO family protein n=1 Tax=Pseudomonas sp. 273 TaxID=75692 RepID=UPI0023D7E959|nr:SCO family protein [Pseudomonas sp. 273]
MTAERLAPWALCLLLWAGLAPAAAFDPFASARIDAAHLGQPLPRALRLTDQHGRAWRLGELLDGRPLLLVPLYYRCPNVCGTTLSTLFTQLDGLPGYRLGRDYRLLAFSFDAAEGPAEARAEQQRLARRWPQLAASPGLFLLSSDAATSRALAAAIGFGYAREPGGREFAHASAVAVVGADGRLSRWLQGLGYQREDLRLALTEAGQGRIGGLGERLLLLCYHYDPRNGVYSSRIMALLRGAAALTALALGLLVLLALRRERRQP